jgi:ribonuclease HI
VKLNIDAAFSVKNFSGAAGAVIRDDQGIFMAGCCGTIPQVADAATVEAMALRLGPTLAGEVGFNRIEINSDCTEVVDMMQNGGNSIGSATAIYEQCSFLARNLLMLKSLIVLERVM